MPRVILLPSGSAKLCGGLFGVTFLRVACTYSLDLSHSVSQSQPSVLNIAESHWETANARMSHQP